MFRQETLKRIIDYAGTISDLDQDLVDDGLSILKLHREVEMLAEKYTLKRYGISWSQFDTLEVLFHNRDDSITPTQLAEEVHLSKPTITGTLNSLKRKKFISREAHPSDRRMIIIKLTPKGIALCKKIMPIRYRETCRVMISLSKEARKTLRKVYGQILDRLREMEAEAGN